MQIHVRIHASRNIMLEQFAMCLAASTPLFTYNTYTNTHALQRPPPQLRSSYHQRTQKGLHTIITRDRVNAARSFWAEMLISFAGSTQAS